MMVALTAGMFLTCLNANAQKWEMKQVPVKTRWAKDVNPDNILQEYPRPQLVRKQWQNLNGLWDYAITLNSESVPKQFDGKILVPYPIESALSGVKKTLLPSQNLWYKRSFICQNLKNGERLLLHFGAVDWKATVFVNGNQIGEHKGGYQNISLDITDVLKNGSNELIVKVVDPSDLGVNPHGKQALKPEGIMYSASSGIWQTVWLETVSASYISEIRCIPNIDKGLLSFSAIVNGKHDGCRLEISVLSGKELVCKVSNAPSTIFNLPVKHPKLWSPATPFLYDLHIRLFKGGKVIDDVKSYFGMRKIEIKKDSSGQERLFLNNQYVYNMGVLDQGYWPEGLYTAPTDAALKFDVEAIKAMGFNTIRKHIKIEPARWYHHCDKLGMMVWQDMINPGNNSREARDQFEKENAENIKQLCNYPCITTWVLFNEGWGAYDQARLTKWVKDIDPTRIVNGHSGENYFRQSLEDSSRKWANSDLTDIHTYPDPKIAPLLPGKAGVLGEFGGIGVPIEGHQWNDVSGWGYVDLNSGELLKRYAIMIDSLKKYETLGLSGSIYTEPFDVEGEQNGLITYDREIIKMPLSSLLQIHSNLIPSIASRTVNTGALSLKTPDTANILSQYNFRLKEYEKGNKDSTFLRRLLSITFQLKDTTNTQKILNDYFGILRNPYEKANLELANKFITGSKDKYFSFFFNNPIKVDGILGAQVAKKKVMAIIFREEIFPETLPFQRHEKHGSPDWETIEKKVVEKYALIGEEKVLYSRMLYDFSVEKNWKNFANSYLVYFSKYGSFYNDVYSGNNLAWAVFQFVENKSTIEEAIKYMKQAIQTEPTAIYIDTYSNLLYKSGRVTEAITLEEQACKLEPQNQVFRDVLKKMKNRERTW